MRLILHPDSACAAVSRIDVVILRNGPRLMLEYRTQGLPAYRTTSGTSPSEVERADDLWRHTCFEAFLRPAGGEGYFEFNFSPALSWAAYRFDGYRRDRRNVDPIAVPAIRTLTEVNGFQLTAELMLDGLPRFAGDWRVALSAVIEETNGNISYWALKHPPGKADFHHADGFALELPAT
jgi:hypothetical protein